MGKLLAATLAGCAALMGQHPDQVVVSSAAAVQPSDNWLPTAQRAYSPRPVSAPLCRVEGTIEGNIGFELWLPQDWNRRYLGAGVGGDAGVFNYADMSLRVNEGFAVASTDSGHKAGDARWMADAKARVDYEHRAVHLTTVAARRLTEAFYGAPVSHAYFTGCSGGGRQALKSLQNYPADFDGILAGAPGPYMPLQSVRMMWFALLQKWSPDAALTDADWTLYEARVTQACDAGDGRVDGIVENPAACTFDLATLECPAGLTGGDCIPAPRLAMLRAITSPLLDESGAAMDGGLFPGVRTRPGPPSPLLRAMWADGVFDDPHWDEDTFQRSRDLAAANRAMPELRADRTAINAFVRLGGKAIIYQGWADPSTNAGPTIDWYAGLARANGGLEQLAQTARLFMVPGMYHCAGGPGADQFGGSGHAAFPGDPARDALWALIRWVEQGEAPQTLTATRLENGAPAFTRTLCPFPSALQFEGPDDAQGACRVDPVLSAIMSAS
ncbi:tannase/feruloyl esterase family alpha/beta hydrolase [Alteraurantiacibacter palmitatis]|uniref:Tannase/feruloyl esterase family alpha/beta hydrolase n=1 Tax=Alteraurantiacibacter palmitatis TaxID=2054628 RepID=A0ABV7E902_9SPHN